MSEQKSFDLWWLLRDISDKENWYQKVFNSEIVAKWAAEMKERYPEDKDQHLFHCGIRLLQASAQGSKLTTSCEWDECSQLCKDCEESLKKDILTNPEKYDLTPEDVQDGLDDYNLDEFIDEPCEHSKCSCVAPDCSLDKYIEYLPQGVLSADLHELCKRNIAEMETQEPIDWHPYSNEQVRDLIHPSMYCYVRGKSDTQDDAPEDSRYQWLPSQFTINEDRSVKVSSYINNLDTEKYPQFVPMIEQVFEVFLPSLERVLKTKIINQELQVIVKVGSVILDESKPQYPGGSWHIEGMPYEHIAATCIHYVAVDGITDSFLEFRKPTIVNDEDLSYPQSDSAYTTHHYGITPDSHFDGSMNRYLGLIKSQEGASVIFPNSLQHRVKDFKLEEGAQSAVRTIIAFFVIDPQIKITSTADIPPQQQIFTQEEALHYRERLMFFRKYFVNRLNKKVFERPFSLCEH